MLEELMVPFAGFVIRKLAEITKKLISKRMNQKENRIYGEIEPKYPRVNITGRPWMNPVNYYKGFLSDPVPIKAEFDSNQRSGLLKVAVLDLRGDYVKMVSARAGVIEVKAQQSSEVDLESGENFLVGDFAEMRIALPTPVKVLSDSVGYSGGELLIPIRVDVPVAPSSIRVLRVPPPQMIPRQVDPVSLPVNRKTKTAIPLFA